MRGDAPHNIAAAALPPTPETNPDRYTSLIEKKKEEEIVIVIKRKRRTAPRSRLRRPPRSHIAAFFFLVFSPSAHPVINYLALVFWHRLFGDCYTERERGYEPPL